MVQKIYPNSFSGASGMWDGTFARAFRGILQFQAATTVAALNDLTNSTGQTADAGRKMVAIPKITPAVIAGSTGAQKAATETALGTVKNGIAVLVGKLTAINAVAPAIGALVNTGGGTVADAAIVPAVTVALTGVNTSIVHAGRLNAILVQYEAAIYQLALHTNMVCRAVGIAEVVDTKVLTAGKSTSLNTYPLALPTDTGTAVAPADGTGGGEVEVENALIAMGKNLSTITARLNAATSQTVPPMQTVAG